MVLQGKCILIIMYLTAETTEMVIFQLDFSQTSNLSTDWADLRKNDPIGCIKMILLELKYSTTIKNVQLKLKLHGLKS